MISGITVFDHIREKAKSFPVLSTSNTSHPPSSQLLNLTRKRSRDKLLLEPHCEIFVAENLGDNIPKHSVLSPLYEPSETSNCGFNINSDRTQSHGIEGPILLTIVSIFSFTSILCTAAKFGGHCLGELSLDMKQRAANDPLTEEMIFDLIRKKSKNFPVLNGLKVMDSDPLLGMEDRSFAENQPNHTTCKGAHSHRMPRNSTILSNLDRVEKLNTSVAMRTSSETPSKGMLSFGISMVKDCSSSPTESGPFPAVKKERKSSAPEELGSHADTLRMAGETAEVDQFLGFKSVFSFLWGSACSNLTKSGNRSPYVKKRYEEGQGKPWSDWHYNRFKWHCTCSSFLISTCSATSVQSYGYEPA